MLFGNIGLCLSAEHDDLIDGSRSLIARTAHQERQIRTFAGTILSAVGEIVRPSRWWVLAVVGLGRRRSLTVVDARTEARSDWT
jgi:hypothetical protein